MLLSKVSVHGDSNYAVTKNKNKKQKQKKNKRKTTKEKQTWIYTAEYSY